MAGGRAAQDEATSNEAASEQLDVQALHEKIIGTCKGYGAWVSGAELLRYLMPLNMSMEEFKSHLNDLVKAGLLESDIIGGKLMYCDPSASEDFDEFGDEDIEVEEKQMETNASPEEEIRIFNEAFQHDLLAGCLGDNSVINYLNLHPRGYSTIEEMRDIFHTSIGAVTSRVGKLKDREVICGSLVDKQQVWYIKSNHNVPEDQTEIDAWLTSSVQTAQDDSSSEESSEWIKVNS